MTTSGTGGTTGEKRKIAILGGGIGGLTAALDLTATPELREKYEVTVHQMGWRLGGKCATGRNPDMFDRIEEHGIHGFTGAYFNALPMMKAAYEEWATLDETDYGPAPDHPLATFEKAFPPRDSSFFWELHDGRLKRWRIYRPPNGLTLEDAQKFGTLASWLKFMKKAFAQRPPDPDEAPSPDATPTQPRDEVLDPFLDEVEKEIGGADAPNAPCGSGAAKDLDLGTMPDRLKQPPCAQKAEETDAERRDRITRTLLEVILRGLMIDDIEAKGFKSVDHENFADWLRRHGAPEDVMASPLAVSPINTTYQYPNGDYTRPPQMSASAYLQWFLRGFVTLGHAFYLFAGGSGETLVTPIYAILRKRGVKFEFFHRVESIEAERDIVSEVKVTKQASVKRGEYDPFVRVRGLHAWPHTPIYDQLENAEALKGVDLENPYADLEDIGERLSLKVGEDFDHVVIAMPIGALKLAAAPLGRRDADWRAMLEGMTSIGTQNMQIWMSKSLEKLGEVGRDPAGGPWYFLAGNYRGGPHGHADFSKYIEFESWPADATPKTCIYFSGVLQPDGENAPSRSADDARAKAECLALLKMAGSQLRPGFSNPAATASPFPMDFGLLACPHDESAKGLDRFDHQYWRSNTYPSERYTSSPPGTKALRLDPLDAKFRNATVAGDWTDFGMNVGSFEGACMSGKLAASAIEPSLDPARIVGLFPTKGDAPETAKEGPHSS